MLFFLFMSILSHSFFTLVSCNFMSFSFLSAWHNLYLKKLINLYFYSFIEFCFTWSLKDLAGLKEGVL